MAKFNEKTSSFLNKLVNSKAREYLGKSGKIHEDVTPDTSKESYETGGVQEFPKEAGLFGFQLMMMKPPPTCLVEGDTSKVLEV
jgi:hypothetical protein